ncbi:hypothetical protein [Microvirga sp. G4-2]|uniref:hypothetical protein n=1 Tax=Microvirga sp. G4-2 TaxID=3434467 RepID=UPI004043C5EA
MSRLKAILAAGCTVLALGGALAASAPAQAGERTGHWRDGSYATPYGIARPYSDYGYRRHSYWRHHNNGGAIAAGVIGGLALGALAAQPAYPTYYYGTSAYAEPSCYTVRRRFVDQWGRYVVRSDRVCE